MVSSTKGSRITGAERQQLMLSYVRRYQAGESIRSLATATGRSYGFVQGLLKEAGVPLRARGGATRGAEAEADRRERQLRVEAARAAERFEGPVDTANPDPQPPVAPAPATPAGPSVTPAPAAPATPYATQEAFSLQPDELGPRQGSDRVEAERRDLYRAPTSPADLGLPTPPLGVLVPKQDRGRKKAKKIAAKKAEQAGMPRHLRDLVTAVDAASAEASGGAAAGQVEDTDGARKPKRKKSDGKKTDGKKTDGKKSAGKKSEGKKDKKSKKDRKSKKDKAKKKGGAASGADQQPATKGSGDKGKKPKK